MEPKTICLEFFPDQDRLLLEGKIRATLRIARDVQIGDCFYAGRTGLRCRITSIKAIAVGRAAAMYHQKLGYNTTADFLSFWRQAHPYIGLNLARKAFLITFAPEKDN